MVPPGPLDSLFGLLWELTHWLTQETFKRLLSPGAVNHEIGRRLQESEVRRALTQGHGKEEARVLALILEWTREMEGRPMSPAELS